MRVMGIRFGADLWSLLEEEAARIGVSVSQYVREAALARASASAAARGADAFELLAQYAHGSRDSGKAGSERTTLTRGRDARSDAEALMAQSTQAQRQASQLGRKSRASGATSRSKRN
jgi:hypothetical protein